MLLESGEHTGVVTVPAHQRKIGGRKPLPKDLPRIEVIHDLAAADQLCSQGHVLRVIGEQTSVQLDVVLMKI